MTKTDNSCQKLCLQFVSRCRGYRLPRGIHSFQKSLLLYNEQPRGERGEVHMEDAVGVWREVLAGVCVMQ